MPEKQAVKEMLSPEKRKDTLGQERNQSAVAPAVDVKHCDIPDEMRLAAIQLSVEAVTDLETESQMASYIKKEFDKRFGGKWHCIVGRAYGSYVTHDEETFIYLQVGNQVVLLFKST